jgi:hypothetical protein
MLLAAPKQVAIDAATAHQVGRVIRVFDRGPAEGRKFGFDRVQPRGIRRQVDGFHVVTGKELGGRTDIRREIVHDDVKAQWLGIAVAQPFETSHDIAGGLAFANTADQAVGMHVVKTVQLLDAPFPSVGGPMPLGMSLPSPTPAGDGAQFERTQLIVADDDPIGRPLGVER